MKGTREVISAGFVTFYIDVDKDDEYSTKIMAHCFGRSDSLNIDSRPEIDSELIGRKILLNHL